MIFMKIKYKVVISLVLVSIGIQFYRPSKNLQHAAISSDFLVYENAPEPIRSLYTNACYDCHSSHTNYEWYDNIAPISWYVDDNIKRGTFALDFSNWKNLSEIEKEIMFSAIPFNINTDRMPTQNYKQLHPKARLSPSQKKEMTNWMINVKTKFLWEEN